MTIRTVEGAAFRVESPSRWRMLDCPLVVAFKGTGWWVYPARGGLPLHAKPFRSRDEALTVLAHAARNAGPYNGP